MYYCHCPLKIIFLQNFNFKETFIFFILQIEMAGTRYPSFDCLSAGLEALLYSLWVFVQLEDILRFQFPDLIRTDFPRILWNRDVLVIIPFYFQLIC